MGWEPPDEVIGDLRDEPSPSRLSARLERWRERPPGQGWVGRLGRGGRLVAGGLAVVVLVAVAVVAARAAGGPGRPVLTVVSGSSPDGFWPAAAGARPGPVVLTVTADVRRSRGPGSVASEVVGLTGPGVVSADDPGVMLAAGMVTQVPLRAVLDCDRLPPPLGSAAEPATTPVTSDFGLRVRTTQDTGTTTAVVPAGAIGRRWLALLRTGCAAWYARRDLTVTAVRAHVHPIDPQVDLTLTVRNDGSRTATLSRAAGPRIRLLGDLPAQLPPDSTRTLRLTAVMDGCESIERPLDDGTTPLALDPTLTTVVNLAALAGPAGPTSSASPDSTQDEGLGPVGIVLDRDPGRTLITALNQACAFMGPISPLIKPDAVTYDRASGVLTVPMLIDVEPGRVRYASLAPEQVTGDQPQAYTPIWPVFPHLVPDRTGQLHVVLRFRTPRTGTCPAFGNLIPGFVATLHVPVRGGERVLTYAGQVDVTADRQALALICPPGTGP